MKEPLAFKATYSDWKLIKTRGVVQVVMEVPLSEADAAYQILGGMPDFSQERWFGVAPLKNPPAGKLTIDKVREIMTDKPKRMDWRDVQPAAQAGIRCEDPVFRSFLDETCSYQAATSEDAAEAVREICGVQSRSELGTNHRARVIWKQLDDKFQAWQRVGA